ncbi:hypothetical protein [Sphingomonas sp. YR710]|uniref:hypothetical protein n=1 Tax=Sphingomonas sp. YR710 TaxID=1882773 RepID=UPI00115FFBA7|nr:hypothetical protein [Sphingomonas sp. YR710]
MKISPTILRCLFDVGFEEVGNYKGAIIMKNNRNNNKGEFFPFFSPTLLQYKEGRTLAGLLGSMKSSAIGRIHEFKKASDLYSVTCYSANFKNLRHPPIMGTDHETDIDWCEEIYKVTSKFPITLSGLKFMIDNDVDIFGIKVSTMDIFEIR